MNHINFIFDTLARAHIPITDFAEILKGKVSRQTLHHWKAGGAINDQLRLNITYTVAKRIEKALDEGLLPTSVNLSVAERQEKLKALILKT